MASDTDVFSNVPNIVIDKILEKLPIHMAAQTSVLSTQWRNSWLSLKALYFDRDFKGRLKGDFDDCYWPKVSTIISSILLHHKGPVHEFCFDGPATNTQVGHRTISLSLNQWISFLSSHGVQKIRINSGCYDDNVYIPSYIFWCIELVHLKLGRFSLNPPPTYFLGFPKLKHLVLENIKFGDQNIFCCLMEKCRMLVTLELLNWRGMDHIVINAPSLETLILKGEFESLAFQNIRSLRRVTIALYDWPEKLITVETIDAITSLSTSCQLESLDFDGRLCEFLDAVGFIKSPPVVIFNHLEKLSLSDLVPNDLNVFRHLISMIESCPYIKKLDISFFSYENVGEHILDYNYNYKLNHLVEVKIEGISGTSAELKLVEYLLAVSTVLENMYLVPELFSKDSGLKMTKALMKFSRASSKASLVYLD